METQIIKQQDQTNTDEDQSELTAVVMLSDVITQEMLNAAMKEAVKIGVFPKYADEETYLKHWDAMGKILNAAIAI